MPVEEPERAADAAVSAALRAHHGRLFAILVKNLKDFHLAEDCLQDAAESALQHWARSGPPDNPAGWLLQAARRKAIDRIRRDRNFERKSVEYALLIDLDQGAGGADDSGIPDERLRLIFTCCHPALEEKSRVALTLRTLCGLTTGSIARAFLDTDEAMAQRLVRAKQKISKAGIPYEVPGAADWPERLQSVLSVIYLVFNAGYSTDDGKDAGEGGLCGEAIRLGRIMAALRPGEPENSGLLSLMLLNHSRRAARSDAKGRLIPLDRQDRSRWDRSMIDEGLAQLVKAAAAQKPGIYQFQAAIAAVHAQAASSAETHWRDIVLFYDGLHALSGNPVHLLNRAAALSYADSAAEALAALEPLEPALAAYQPFHAARADFLRRLGRNEEARRAYEMAISLSATVAERAFLEERRASIAT